MSRRTIQLLVVLVIYIMCQQYSSYYHVQRTYNTRTSRKNADYYYSYAFDQKRLKNRHKSVCLSTVARQSRHHHKNAQKRTNTTITIRRRLLTIDSFVTAQILSSISHSSSTRQGRNIVHRQFVVIDCDWQTISVSNSIGNGTKRKDKYSSVQLISAQLSFIPFAVLPQFCSLVK